MRILGLDLSTHTGYSVFSDEKLEAYGLLEVKIEDFSLENDTTSPLYPYNLLEAAGKMARFGWGNIFKV